MLHLIFNLWYSKAHVCTHIALTPYSCSSRITSNCLTQLYTDISGWPDICSYLYFYKPPSHLHHMDKRQDTALRWQHLLLVSVPDQQRVSHLPQHSDSDGKAPRTLCMPCHHWRMGESTKLYTKCQQEYNSDRSVVSDMFRCCVLWGTV